MTILESLAFGFLVLCVLVVALRLRGTERNVRALMAAQVNWVKRTEVRNESGDEPQLDHELLWRHVGKAYPGDSSYARPASQGSSREPSKPWSSA